MKKILPILFILSLLFSLVSSVLSIVTLTVVLKKEDTSTIVSQNTPSQEQPQVSVALPDDTGTIHMETRVLSPVNGTDWHFEFPMQNDTDAVLTLNSVVVYDHLGGPEAEPHNEHLITSERFTEIGITNAGPDLILSPGDSHFWEDWHPVVEHFDARTYIFVFDSSAGSQISFLFPFSLPLNSASSTSSDTIRMDVQTLFPVNGTDWHFQFSLQNTVQSDLTLNAIIVHNHMGGPDTPPLDEFLITSERFAEIGIVNNGPNLILAPGENFQWQDGHPVVEYFDSRTYTFVFDGSDGKQVSLAFPFILASDGSGEPSSAINADYSFDDGKDLTTLRHDAQFSCEVYPGVYWVPASTLGSSEYTNSQIYQLLGASPVDKQDHIETLYEALQLYQIGAFSASDDNIRSLENNINWEHHKPGFHAVRTNTGCCASSANWLNYILRDDYDEVGFIATSQRDGNGHIYNYIKEDGWYYIIDMTHYRTDWIATAVESGNIDDYHRSESISGNIHKVKDIQLYVNYVQEFHNDPPGLMFMYTAEDCLALDGIHTSQDIVIVYENNSSVKLNVIFDYPNDNLKTTLKDSPRNRPDWNITPDYPFPGM